MLDNGRWDRVRKVWEIVERLRGENGCPWDRKQTPVTLQTYLIEESHEAAAAVRSGDAGEVAEELGDLLFMVFFLTYLYEEQGSFRLEDVCELIHEKMIRRHPHVFGDVTVNSAQDVLKNWQKIKDAEKAESGKTSGGVPESLPALVRAYRIVSRLSGREGNGGWNEARANLDGFREEAASLETRMAAGERPSGEAFGSLLLKLVNLARIEGYRAEDCLHQVLGGLPKEV
jgi:MazG family protein